MWTGWFDSAGLRTLEAGLNLLARKQQLIAQNLANAETPGYKKWNLDFQSALRDAVQAGTGSDPLQGVAAGRYVQRVAATSTRNDGNNVDVDQEMVELAETTLHYSAAARQTQAAFSLLDIAISGGRR